VRLSYRKVTTVDKRERREEPQDADDMPCESL
jgi:hypothetical protein